MLRVASIGAGPTGLSSAKEQTALGHKVTIFDRHTEIGGTWNPRALATWDGMETNLAWPTCSFSDHPHPDDAADFLSVPDMYRYLCDYSSRWNGSTDFRLGESVQKATPLSDGWEITFSSRQGRVRTEYFDKLITGSGFFSRAFIPEVEGSKEFRGRILHTSGVRSAVDFAGQHVVVIANGLGGTEIASYLSQEASKVTHVFRRPVWTLERYLNDPELELSLPLDLLFYRRQQKTSEPLSAEEVNRRRNRFLHSLSKQNGMNIPELFIDPDSPEFYPVAISDAYLTKVNAGAIDVRGGEQITRMDLDTIHLARGTIEKVDAIVFATGYRFDLPYLDSRVKELIQFDGNDPFQPTILYKTMLHADLPNLAFIGAYKGPYFGTMELQARLAAQVFAGGPFKIDSESYRNGILEETRIRGLNPRPQFPHSDYVGFADELARLVGCFPDLASNDMFAADVNGGAVIPAHYRLKGPGSNPSIAQKVITRVRNQFFKPKTARAS